MTKTKANRGPGARTVSGRLLHKDDPIEAWNEAAARINAHTIAQRREPEATLTGDTLRAQTLLADEILAEIFADERSCNRSGRPASDRAALTFATARFDARDAARVRETHPDQSRMLVVRAYNGLRDALALRDGTVA